MEMFRHVMTCDTSYCIKWSSYVHGPHKMWFVIVLSIGLIWIKSYLRKDSTFTVGIPMIKVESYLKVTSFVE